ncbi:uncharacterized protein BDR25DRAFT_302613 [Lindgomyces ingoldianus]|uniref:Uncharacterized protein n=1 Tax=Lindgomyces ingoldianus TaxID=673940 RepID=A0ACB6R0V3_9PLEO|nr:uncharacterized protein BDR25DRAFT_302613 [Lindgomyces ingoldianus]KAF2472420.1 hypothetical protein BDR25DRAFT_302613 [Lindgomyces ingoldianus]
MESESPQTFRERLDAGEEYWRWKCGLRTVLVVIGLIGIGCMAWATQYAARGPYTYQLDDSWTICWTLITFSLTVVWCLVALLVLFLRRPPAPVHPGVAVGLDLVIWLAYIPTALFAIVGVMNVLNFGSDGTIANYSSYGYYTQASNGTWVWHQTDYDSYYNRTRTCDEGYYYRYDSYGFSSCAEEDAYVNGLWAGKNRRAGVEMTGVVCQFLGLLLHLALFIWACVDTHRRNSRKVSKEAEKLAANIVMSMVRSGAVVQNPGTSPQAFPYPQQPYPTFTGTPTAPGPAPILQPASTGTVRSPGSAPVPPAPVPPAPVPPPQAVTNEKVEQSARFA